MNAKFVINLLQVAVHGPKADPQCVSDFFVEAAFAEQVENFAFALGEPSHIARRFQEAKRLDQVLKVTSDVAGDANG
jgi:hypothetical protein